MAVPLQSHVLRRPRGWRSEEAALFVAQLDDLSRLLWRDMAGASSAELVWQPKRGLNTQGMLLAHMAIVEAFWIQRATTGVDDAKLERLLGIGVDDDGIPLPAGGTPPRALHGWKVGDYRALEARARSFTRRHVRRFTAADLQESVRADRPGGPRRSFQRRWILHHLVEHYAGHYGQILLLRHLYRSRRAKR
ncbi:MAG: DUF664 domain-containing protein [Candidatus Eisenbacteria bacterium]|nr:DUF664 domain-containing protein [Candidatus Eisenbacteria bacterium]